MKSIEKLQRVINAIRDMKGQENEATVKFACNLINEFLIDNETAPKGKADLSTSANGLKNGVWL